MAHAADDPEGQARLAAFLQGLRELGWIEGRNLRLDYRWGGGDVARIRRDAVELAALAPWRLRARALTWWLPTFQSRAARKRHA